MNGYTRKQGMPAAGLGVGPVVTHEFTMRFTSTPRGARLARRLVTKRLDAWGHPYGSAANDSVTLIAAELAANTVRHGRLPGRDFRLRLTVRPGLIRVEVADTHPGRPASPAERLDLLGESGRGLAIVAALASRWGCAPRTPEPSPGKTVWAEYAVDASSPGA